MDALSSDSISVSGVMQLKAANQRAAVDVSLMKKNLDMQKLIGAEIAKMLGAGVNVDIRA